MGKGSIPPPTRIVSSLVNSRNARLANSRSLWSGYRILIHSRSPRSGCCNCAASIGVRRGLASGDPIGIFVRGHARNMRLRAAATL